jgi:hypothetical protein
MKLASYLVHGKPSYAPNGYCTVFPGLAPGDIIATATPRASAPSGILRCG